MTASMINTAGGAGALSTDLAALRAAAAAVTAAVTTVGGRDATALRDLDCRPGALGHVGLAAALNDCTQRWATGVTSLVGDAAELADSLAGVVAAYGHAEGSADGAVRAATDVHGHHDTGAGPLEVGR